MIHTEKYIQSGAHKIYTQAWEIENAKANVGLIHGMWEHSNRYEHVALYLNSRGYNAYAMDHIGHGRSDGKKGHVDNYDLLLDSVQTFLDEIKSHNNLPVFLYGHSMGGNVLTNFLIRRQPNIKGALLSSPWYKLATAPPAFQLLLAKIMIKIYPSFQDTAKVDQKGISRDPIEVQKYVDDPMVFNKMTPAFFFPTFENGLYAIAHAKEIKVPALLFHGTADRLTSHEGSVELSKNANSNVEFVSLEGMYHETHNDIGKEKVLDMMATWLDKNV